MLISVTSTLSTSKTKKHSIKYLSLRIISKRSSSNQEYTRWMRWLSCKQMADSFWEISRKLKILISIGFLRIHLLRGMNCYSTSLDKVKSSMSWAHRLFRMCYRRYTFCFLRSVTLSLTTSPQHTTMSPRNTWFLSENPHQMWSENSTLRMESTHLTVIMDYLTPRIRCSWI